MSTVRERPATDRAVNPIRIRVASLALVVGSFVQLGLGYAGHRGGLAVASAVHVPLGVTLLGLAVAVAVATRPVPLGGTPREV